LNDKADLPLIRHGGCLCGEISYRVIGEIRGVINCFCSQCRKTSGHYVAAVRCNLDQLEILKNKTIAWYRSSEIAQRGFCSQCGSSLFWKPHKGDTISIMAGTLDTPTHVESIENIFIEDMSDYQELPGLHCEK